MRHARPLGKVQLLRRLHRIRTSTLVLLTIFVVALGTYSYVKPPAPAASYTSNSGGSTANTGQPTGTASPSYSPSPTFKPTATHKASPSISPSSGVSKLGTTSPTSSPTATPSAFPDPAPSAFGSTPG